MPDNRPEWVKDWASRRDRRPEWARDDLGPIPADGSPAPTNTGGIDWEAINERGARRDWERAHVAWLNANGLAWNQADLDAWWSRPDRDQVPMPGVLQWQQRISGYYSGTYGSYGGSGQPLDYPAHQEIQALRQEIQALYQARQSDAARIAWTEEQASRVSGDLGDRTDERDKLTARLEQQYQRESELAATLADQKKEIAQLSEASSRQQAQIERSSTETARLQEELTEKDAANGRLKESNGQLETMVRNLKYDVQAKDAVIAQLETAAHQAADAEVEAKRALRTHGQVIAWQDDLVTRLKADNQRLKDLTAKLRARISRRAGYGNTAPARQITAGADARA